MTTKKTLVVNLFEAPGAGKSTFTCLTFGRLKMLGIDCEIANEFAKDLVYECRNDAFRDEAYIYAKQEHRVFRLRNKVDVIITDRPLVLTCLYASERETLCKLCWEDFNTYRNLNFFIPAGQKKYNPNGRNQTEEEAKQLGDATKALLDNNNVDYTVIDYDTGLDVIINKIQETLANLDSVYPLDKYKKYDASAEKGEE